MIVKNDLYDYGLEIYQNTDYFKFSIDSLLLAEFVHLKNGMSVLDMCTGNAPIPLVLSTKGHNLDIDAVEIQKEVYELAKRSIETNYLTDIIHIYNEDVLKFQNDKKYDVVTCNPPYFKNIPTSEKSNNKVKSIARHEIKLTLEEAITTANNFLKENGTFYIVHRAERFLETCDILKNKGLGIRKSVFVYTKQGRQAEFFLIEASKSKKSDLKVYSLYIENLKTYKNIFEEELR